MYLSDSLGIAALAGPQGGQHVGQGAWLLVAGAEDGHSIDPGGQAQPVYALYGWVSVNGFFWMGG